MNNTINHSPTESHMAIQRVRGHIQDLLFLLFILRNPFFARASRPIVRSNSVVATISSMSLSNSLKQGRYTFLTLLLSHHTDTCGIKSFMSSKNAARSADLDHDFCPLRLPKTRVHFSFLHTSQVKPLSRVKRSSPAETECAYARDIEAQSRRDRCDKR
jgi:hypothetical protein